MIVTTSESWIPLICYDFHGSESNNMNGSILKGFWVSNICRRCNDDTSVVDKVDNYKSDLRLTT